MGISNSRKGPYPVSNLALLQWKLRPRVQTDLFHATCGTPAAFMVHTITSEVQWAPQRKPGP